MTDQDTKKRKPAGSERARSDSGESKATASAQSSRGPVFLTLLLILTLGAVGYYWVTEIHAPNMSAIEARIAAIDAADDQFSPRLEDIEARSGDFEDARQALANDIASLRKAQESLEASVKALYAKDTQSSLNWVLAEAEYLILAAMQRLVLERDVKTAIAALRAADNRLRSAEHPDLIAVREQIAKDMTALESVDLPDVEGLAIYLAETIARVDALPTKPIAEIDMNFSRMQNEPATAENWRGVAKAMWADLVSLIEIKDGELPDGVLFDPELRYFLQQNLRLELASARLSVLRRDNANFRAAAKLIIGLLDQYYDTEHAGVAAVIARLNDEQATDLDPSVPGISESLDTIRGKRLSARTAEAAGIAATD